MVDHQSWRASGFKSYSIFFFLLFIYINDLSNNLESNVKLFADDTSIFLVFSEPINSQKLNKNLYKVGLWANKWKMFFNLDPSKQTQEVIFSQKINKVYPHLFYLIIPPLSKYQLKNIWEYILMKSLHSNIILMRR